MDFDREHDAAVRNAAFGWLALQVSGEDGVVSRDVLLRMGSSTVAKCACRYWLGNKGFSSLVIMELPLSITTSPNGPYNDEMGADKLLRPPLSFGHFPR